VKQSAIHKTEYKARVLAFSQTTLWSVTRIYHLYWSYCTPWVSLFYSFFVVTLFRRCLLISMFVFVSIFVLASRSLSFALACFFACVCERICGQKAANYNGIDRQIGFLFVWQYHANTAEGLKNSSPPWWDLNGRINPVPIVGDNYDESIYMNWWYIAKKQVRDKPILISWLEAGCFFWMDG